MSVVLNDIAVQLTTARDELDELIDELTSKRARVVAALAALWGTEPAPEATPASPIAAAPTPKKSTPKKQAAQAPKRAAAKRVRCDVEGCSFESNPQGLAIHKKHKHRPIVAPWRAVVAEVQRSRDEQFAAVDLAPESRPESFVEAAAAATATTPPEFTAALRDTTRARYMPDGKVLACTEKGCGFEAGSIHDLVSHTNARHNREPLREERWPVLPAAAPVPT